MNIYMFIEAEKVEVRNVSRTCALLSVSRSAYCEWRRHIPSAHLRADTELSERISEIHRRSRGTYGAPRVAAELRRDGIGVSRKRVARLMAQQELAGRTRRRSKQTTIADPTATLTPLDRLCRNFAPGGHELDSVYVGDITYVRTHEGWLYLATAIDLASRRVVGFAMADHMRASLVCDALRMAIELRCPGAGLTFHSDRGSQYTSREFRALLDEHGLVQSLSRPRQCWDNAVAESFFSTLKQELVYRLTLATRAQARAASFEFIEIHYNRARLHSSLNYRTPAEYEAERRASEGATSQAA